MITNENIIKIVDFGLCDIGFTQQRKCGTL